MHTHTHTSAVRSGDYYLFADLDEKIQLHLLSERASAAIADTITEKKLADKMTIEQVNVFFLIFNFWLARGAHHIARATVANFCTK